MRIENIYDFYGNKGENEEEIKKEDLEEKTEINKSE